MHTPDYSRIYYVLGIPNSPFLTDIYEELTPADEHDPDTFDCDVRKLPIAADLLLRMHEFEKTLEIVESIVFKRMALKQYKWVLSTVVYLFLLRQLDQGCWYRVDRKASLRADFALFKAE